MTRQVPSQQWQLSHLRYQHLTFAQYAPSYVHYRQHSSFIRYVYHASQVEVHVQSMRHGGLV
ncbi:MULTISPECIES: hypothetical protein [unclassified Pseudoalteromonas]|uniref:hypothetical protein n=1 Tax=unclassified Pseudoalteromonas TaxID=194690 RepID=UPI002097EA06|nr:hypothetical protein [Pseudoalteromonas sp. XMcav2-N]MCO7189960.1 hypothetical protein [Pseudoalteromonas sp. XMcav2-N]